VVCIGLLLLPAVLAAGDPAPWRQDAKARPGGDDVAEWKRLRAALKPGDVPGRLEMADWARRLGLHEGAESLYLEVLKLDSSNVPAHRGLGHVYVEGHWITTESAQAAERALLEAMLRKAGLVRYGPGWETSDGVRQRQDGRVYVDGQWRRPDLARAARGEVRIDGEWVGPREALCIATRKRLAVVARKDFSVDLGKHVIVASTLPEKEHRMMLQALDAAVEDLLALLQAANRATPWPLPVRAIVLRERDQLLSFEAWIPFLPKKVPVWFRPDDDGYGLRLFYDNLRRPVLVVHVDPSLPESSRVPAIRGLLVYGLTRLTLGELTQTELPPYWIAEGLAVMTEAMRAPGVHVSSVGARPPKVEPASPFDDLKSLKAFLVKRGPIPLEKLVNLLAEDSGQEHVAEAVAFLTFLTGHYPRATAVCLAPPVREGDQVRRLQEAAGKPLKEIEAEFFDWVKK